MTANDIEIIPGKWSPCFSEDPDTLELTISGWRYLAIAYVELKARNGKWYPTGFYGAAVIEIEEVGEEEVVVGGGISLKEHKAALAIKNCRKQLVDALSQRTYIKHLRASFKFTDIRPIWSMYTVSEQERMRIKMT